MDHNKDLPFQRKGLGTTTLAPRLQPISPLGKPVASRQPTPLSQDAFSKGAEEKPSAIDVVYAVSLMGSGSHGDKEAKHGPASSSLAPQDEYFSHNADFFNTTFEDGYRVRLKCAVAKWCQGNGRAKAIKCSKGRSGIKDLVGKYLMDETAIMTLAVLIGFDDILYPAKPNAVVDYVCHHVFPGLDGTRKHSMYRHMDVQNAPVDRSVPGTQQAKVGKRMKGIKNLKFDRGSDSHRMFLNRKVMLPISFGDSKFQVPKDFEDFQNTTLYAVLEYLRQFSFTSFDVVLFATSQAATCQIYNLLRAEGAANLPSDTYTDGLLTGASDADVLSHLTAKARDWIDAFTPYLNKTEKTPHEYTPLSQAIGCEIKIYGVEELITQNQTLFDQLSQYYHALGHSVNFDESQGAHGKSISSHASSASASMLSSPERSDASEGSGSDGEGKPVMVACSIFSKPSVPVLGHALEEECFKLQSLLDACRFTGVWQYRKVLDDYHKMRKDGLTTSMESFCTMIQVTGAVYTLLDLISVKTIPTHDNRSQHEAWLLGVKSRFLTELNNISKELKAALIRDDAITIFQAFVVENSELYLTKSEKGDAVLLDVLPHVAVLGFVQRYNILTTLMCKVKSSELAQSILRLSRDVRAAVDRYPIDEIGVPRSPRGQEAGVLPGAFPGKGMSSR